MLDKIKQARDEHPILDFVAGFMPGIGEAQDAQDAFYAVKNRDYGTLALITAGALLPVINGRQLKALVKGGEKAVGAAKGGSGAGRRVADAARKYARADLTPAMRANPKWEVTKEGRVFFNGGDGKLEFVKNAEGKWQSKSSLEEGAAIRKRKMEEAKAAAAKAKARKEKIRDFEDAAEAFGDKSGFHDFSLSSWQQGVPKAYRMDERQLDLYMTKGAPAIWKSYDDLVRQGKKPVPDNGAGMRPIKDSDGHVYGYEVYYPEGLALKGKHRREAGWATVDMDTALTYLIANSENGRGKFVQTGINAYRGVPGTALADTFTGKPWQNWASSNKANGITYWKGTRGMTFQFLPVKTGRTKVSVIRNSGTNPSSNHWFSADAGSPIKGYLSADSHAVNISETPLYDDLSESSGTFLEKRNPENRGYYTVTGEGVRIKAVKGGTGLYDLSKPGILAGLSASVLLKYIHNSRDEREQ